jgi:hypothetical protein
MLTEDLMLFHSVESTSITKFYFEPVSMGLNVRTNKMLNVGHIH